MATIRIENMFAAILHELRGARASLSEAANWARSDWSDSRALTDVEAEARAAVLDIVGRAKGEIDHIIGLIFEARRHGARSR